MKDREFEKGIIIVIILSILLIIFGGVIFFWAGYLDGLILKWLIGNWIVKAFEIIHLNITKDQIPLLFGLIGLIASFFKYTIKTTKKND